MDGFGIWVGMMRVDFGFIFLFLRVSERVCFIYLYILCAFSGGERASGRARKACCAFFQRGLEGRNVCVSFSCKNRRGVRHGLRPVNLS